MSLHDEKLHEIVREEIPVAGFHWVISDSRPYEVEGVLERDGMIMTSHARFATKIARK
jgi:hypothetical protein